MAWRLDEAVEHGIIDNTVEGTTTGRIWIHGRDEPLMLSLDGDCWRDLAGTVLEFENPGARADPDAILLDTEQSGIAGDITASRKARVPYLSEVEMDELDRLEKPIPFKWRNILYIEWFSEINGRVLIESPDFVLKISDRQWEMDEDQEEAQKLANLGAMRDFLEKVIQRTDSRPRKKRADGNMARGELNEFEWEERLKESDRLSDAYQEVLEKYIEDPDSERKEAFVMGWDGLLGEMAEREEGGGFDDFDDEDEDDSREAWQAADDDDDEDDGEDPSDQEIIWRKQTHPLHLKSVDLATRASVLVGMECEAESPADRLVSSLMQVCTKLGGVLCNGDDEDFQPESGFILAVLKRCLNWINEAIGACGALLDSCDDVDLEAALQSVRQETFSVRDDILELRRELKQS